MPDSSPAQPSASAAPPHSDWGHLSSPKLLAAIGRDGRELDRFGIVEASDVAALGYRGDAASGFHELSDRVSGMTAELASRGDASGPAPGRSLGHMALLSRRLHDRVCADNGLDPRRTEPSEARDLAPPELGARMKELDFVVHTAAGRLSTEDLRSHARDGVETRNATFRDPDAPAAATRVTRAGEELYRDALSARGALPGPEPKDLEREQAAKLARARVPAVGFDDDGQAVLLKGTLTITGRTAGSEAAGDPPYEDVVTVRAGERLPECCTVKQHPGSLPTLAVDSTKPAAVHPDYARGRAAGEPRVLIGPDDHDVLSVRLVSDGGCNLKVTGSREQGSRTVDAFRGGAGYGDAFVTDARSASANRDGSGPGDARCLNVLHGSADRAGSGRGNAAVHAHREGDATHRGSGPGNATVNAPKGHAYHYGRAEGYGEMPHPELGTIRFQGNDRGVPTDQDIARARAAQSRVVPPVRGAAAPVASAPSLTREQAPSR